MNQNDCPTQGELDDLDRRWRIYVQRVAELHETARECDKVLTGFGIERAALDETATDLLYAAALCVTHALVRRALSTYAASGCVLKLDDNELRSFMSEEMRVFIGNESRAQLRGLAAGYPYLESAVSDFLPSKVWHCLSGHLSQGNGHKMSLVQTAELLTRVFCNDGHRAQYNSKGQLVLTMGVVSRKVDGERMLLDGSVTKVGEVIARLHAVMDQHGRDPHEERLDERPDCWNQQPARVGSVLRFVHMNVRLLSDKAVFCLDPSLSTAFLVFIERHKAILPNA